MTISMSTHIQIPRLVGWMLLLATPLVVLRAADEPALAGPATMSLFVNGIDPNEVLDKVQLSDAPMDAVLPYLQYLTGRVILRPQQLPAPQITIDAEKLTRAEALFAFETLLSLNQIGLVPSGEKFLKVVGIASIRTEAPELVTRSLADDPPSGKVVSKLFRLEYLDSTSFQTQVGPLLSPFATVVPFQNSNMVMVTDTVANLQRLEYVVKQVDRQLEIETKFYEVQYAQAAPLADQIRQMIESARTGLTGGQGGTRAAVSNPDAGPSQMPAPGASGLATGGVPLQVVVSSSTSITADERTNQIIVITNPGNLVFFDNLIAKLDVPAEAPTAIEVFYMKHADAVEMGSLLSQFVSGRSGSSATSDRQPGPGGRTTPFPALNPEIENLSRPIGPSAQVVQETVNEVVEAQGSQFSELMTIVPDERTNSLVVSGTNNDLRLITRVVDKLDIILAQVHIEAVIAEVTLGDDLVRGLDAFSFTVDTQSGDFDLISASGVIGGLGLSYADDLLTGVYGASNNDSRDRINIMAVPSIVTTHNREADIIVATALPIITGTQRGGIDNSQFTTTQYQDIGIELTVKPMIGPNDVIQLEVSQKADDVTGEVDVGNGITQPEISRREANSFLILKDGQVAVLGGLQRENDQKSVQSVFLLGDIPVVGELFRRTRTSVRKQDLLIFLRPRIIRNTDEADLAARERIRGLRLNEDGSRKIEQITGEKVEPQEDDIMQKAVDAVRPGP